ncbi:MAG: response regulator [Elusimicrobia bacterium]|nr:response regulator [Elusimicrobiota bacterium]
MSVSASVYVVIIGTAPEGQRRIRACLERLKDWPLEIYHAPRAEEAIPKLKENFHNLVFADSQTGPMSELIDRLRQYHPKCAIVILSSQPDVRQAVSALKRGATDYLSYEELETVDLKNLLRRVIELGYMADPNMELRQVNEMKNEFIANVSHELRTPLSVIIGYAETLKGSCLGPVTADQKKALESIINRSMELLRTVNQILKARAAQAGREALDLKPLDLRQMLSERMKSPGQEFAQKGIKLNADLPESEVWVHVDRQRISEVFENLLSNASKFGPENSEVRLSLSAQDDTARVSIQDQGPGVSPEMLPRLFDHFSAASQGPTREHGGLGLSLFLSKYILEQHYGRIWLESPEDGKGCRAIFELPLMPKKDKKRILLVEDNPDVLDLMMLFLSGVNQNFDIHTAKSGFEAMEDVRARNPDLIILDVMMPGMSGFQVIERLRALQRTRDIPILVLTGYDDAAHKARLIGAQDVLMKPFKRDVLVDKIFTLLGLGSLYPSGKPERR